MHLAFTPAYPIGPHYVLYPIPPPLKRPISDFAAALQNSHDYFELRIQLMKSFTGIGFIRQIFALPQPEPAEILISGRDGTFIGLLADFSLRAPPSHIAHYLPEPIADFFGDEFRGEAVLGLASAAAAFVENIETVRAFLEIVVFEESAEATPEGVHEGVAAITDRVLAMAPPRVPGAEAEDSLEWIRTLIAIVDGARSLREKGDTLPAAPSASALSVPLEDDSVLADALFWDP
jgi:hypothetical protein